MLTIIHYSNDQKTYYNSKSLSKGIKIAQKRKLFVPGWCFEEWLEEGNMDHIFLAFYKEKAIGCCILFENMEIMCNFGIFVKEKYRRLGIGSRIINRVLEIFDFNMIKHGYGDGDDGSFDFFEKALYENHGR